MKLYYHHLYSQLELPERHRFPVKKYQQLKHEVECLGSVDLCRLKFVQTRGDLIAARGL